jgi:hypothetical protein
VSNPLNRKLASSAVFLVLAGMVIYFLLPDAGGSQFARTDRALQNARSWQSRRLVQEPGKRIEETLEIYCPSRSRHWSKTTVGDSTVELETIHIEHTDYTRTGGVWNTWSSSPSRTPNLGTCTWGPRGVDDLLGQMGTVMRIGHIRKAGKRTVNDTSCRDWIASLPVPTGWRDAFLVCVASDDLPVEVATSDRTSVTTYSDWNKLIVIESPDQGR